MLKTMFFRGLYATAQMESVMGISGVLPRYPERQVKIIKGGSVSLHNINITNSSIGVLNTGNLEMVDSAITVLKNDQATYEIAKAISNLTNAIASSNLPAANKNEAIEILSVVASEATAPDGKRKVSVVKQLLAHFPTVIQTAASVIQIWQAVEPTLTKFFP